MIKSALLIWVFKVYVKPDQKQNKTNLSTYLYKYFFRQSRQIKIKTGSYCEISIKATLALAEISAALSKVLNKTDLPKRKNKQIETINMSESDTSLSANAFIRLKRENEELKIEKAQLTEAFSRLKASIGKDMEITEELRKEMKSKLNEMEYELKGKQDELKEARIRITQLENELMNRGQVSKQSKSMIEDLKSQLSNQISSEIRRLFEASSTSNTYNTLSNLVVEAGEVIQDIQSKLILDDVMISEMNTDRIQKLVRNTEDHEKANEKLMSLKVEIRNELGSTREYSDTLQNEAKEAIESLTETKKQLDNTLRMLEVEASDRKIKFSKLDIDTSKFYKVPTFTGESAEGVNIYEFFEQLTSYLEAIDISPDEYGAVLKKSLQGTALNIVNKVFPNTLRPSMAEVKSLLIKHFGKPENILASLKAKHEEIGRIPNTGDGDMDVVYKRSSDHACHIQKALMLENNGRQVEFPRAYIDTIENMLPDSYLDKYQTWEIRFENENATPREKLEKLKELIDEIEAKGLLKASLPSVPTTSKLSYHYEEPDTDDRDTESISPSSISDHDWFDTDEDDEKPKPHWNKPAYH